jgi:UrcA family protein
MFKANKITSAVLALAILAPLPAMAETVSVSVRYADLNLASAEGQQAFNRRIAAAGRQICGAVDNERDLSRRASITKCLSEVRTSAEPARLAAIANKARAVS